MSIKVAKNDFTRKMKPLHLYKNCLKNAGDLGKLIVAKGFKSWPKCNKSPNLVSLSESEAKVVSWYGVVVSISSSA